MILYVTGQRGYSPLEVSDMVADALGLRHGMVVTPERAEELRAVAFSAHLAIGEALAIAAAGNLPDEPPTVEDIWR